MPFERVAAWEEISAVVAEGYFQRVCLLSAHVLSLVSGPSWRLIPRMAPRSQLSCVAASSALCLNLKFRKLLRPLNTKDCGKVRQTQEWDVRAANMDQGSGTSYGAARYVNVNVQTIAYSPGTYGLAGLLGL
jgi:hypothetical protein